MQSPLTSMETRLLTSTTWIGAEVVLLYLGWDKRSVLSPERPHVSILRKSSVE